MADGSNAPTTVASAKAWCVHRIEEVLGAPCATVGSDWWLPDGRRLVVVYSKPLHGGRDFFVGLPNRLAAGDALVVLLGDSAIVFELAGWLLAYAPYMSRSSDGRPNPRFRRSGNGLVLSVAKVGLEIAVGDRTDRFDRLLSIGHFHDHREGTLGQPFKQKNTDATSIRRTLPRQDLSKQDRATQGHRRTLNLLDSFLDANRGVTSKEPIVGEPNYDLAWQLDGATFVAEVKSLTKQNEEQQMRLGLGQVLRYRQRFQDLGRPMIAVLAVERCPSDPSWIRLCESVGVVLTWPDTFDVLLKARHPAHSP